MLAALGGNYLWRIWGSLSLVGWPAVIAVHVMLALAVIGVWRHVRRLPRA